MQTWALSGCAFRVSAPCTAEMVLTDSVQLGLVIAFEFALAVKKALHRDKEKDVDVGSWGIENGKLIFNGDSFCFAG